MKIGKRLLVLASLTVLVVLALLLWYPQDLREDKNGALGKAVAAMNALPSPVNITLSHRGDVSAARALFEAAKSQGIKDAEIPNLSKLLECEARLKSLETALQERTSAVNKAVAAINALPSPADLTFNEVSDVRVARTWVEEAIKQGATAEAVSNLGKLEALEARIDEVINAEAEKVRAINAAIYAISSLPDPAQITVKHKSLVVAVRGWVEAAKALGAVDADISNLPKLLECEAKLAAAEKTVSYRLKAAEIAAAAISTLPSPQAVTLGDKSAIFYARTLVDFALGG